MPNLELLNLSANEIREVPAEIAQLPKLNTLILRDNQIQNISPQISQNQALKYLDLANNQLQEVPEVLGNLNQLEYLNLTNNQISYLPASLQKLSKLHSIKLDGNVNQADQIILESGHMPSLRSRLYEYLSLNKVDATRQLFAAGLKLVENPSIPDLEKVRYLNLGARIYFWFQEYPRSAALSQEALTYSNNTALNRPNELEIELSEALFNLKRINSGQLNPANQTNSGQLSLRIQELQNIIDKINKELDQERRTRLKILTLLREARNNRESEQKKRIRTEDRLQFKNLQHEHDLNLRHWFILGICLLFVCLLSYYTFQYRRTKSDLYRSLSNQKHKNTQEYNKYVEASMQLKEAETKLKFKEEEIDILKDLLEARKERSQKS